MTERLLGMKRYDPWVVVRLLLVLVVLMPMFTGCAKTKQLEAVEAPEYKLDHVDTFYQFSYSAKNNPCIDEWEKSHLIDNTGVDVFGVFTDKTAVFDIERAELTVVDYAVMKTMETAVDGFAEKSILEARFSGDELLVLSYTGDKGFKSNKYYLSIIDLDGNLKSETEITSAFADDVLHLGQAGDNYYPLFSGNRVLLWDNSNNSFIKESFTPKDKKGFGIRDVKCFNDGLLGILIGQTGDSEESESSVVFTDRRFKIRNSYEFDVHSVQFGQGDDAVVYGYDSLFKVTDSGCEIICNWEDIHMDTPCSVSSEAGLIRVLSTFADLEYDYSGIVTPLNNLYLFNISNRETREITSVKLASLGRNQYYNIEFLTNVFNLTHDDVRIDLKQFDIAEESYNEFTASMRKAYLEMSGDSYDIYFFPFKPLINTNDFDIFLNINGELSSKLEENNCYTKMTYDNGTAPCFLRPFFSLAGSYYCESGFGDRSSTDEINAAYCMMLPDVCAGTDSDLFEKIIMDDPSCGGKYIYDSDISLSGYLKYSEDRGARLSGIPGVSEDAPMVKSCGGFAFNKDIDLNIASEITDFLLSDFVQSFTYEDDSVFPVERKSAAFQVTNYVFLDYSKAVSLVSDGVNVDDSRLNRDDSQENLPCAMNLLDAFDSASVFFEPDPVVGMIFSEEYRLYVEGTVSREAFMDSYTRRISIYLSEINN